MATTTNFGWETPDDTDLVKDGAAAIRTALGGVDTSFVDLKGGTTGQVLSKASNTDLDFVWSADASGIPASIVDAKGDLIAATAADTVARLAVGSNNTVLTADSTTATGLKWATPAPASFVGCIVRDTTQQTIANATQTKITFNTNVIDTNGFHSTTTNTERFTVPTGYAGKYRVVYNTRFGDTNATGERLWELYVNGSNITGYGLKASAGSTTNGYGIPVVAEVVRDLAVGDYVELQVYQDSGTTQSFIRSYNGAFSFQFLGA